MNVFETVKQSVTTRQAAEHYGIRAIDKIPYESGSYYIFDRAYNNFKMLYRIH